MPFTVPSQGKSLTKMLIAGISATVLVVSLIAVAAMYGAVSHTTKAALEQKADEISAYLVGALESPLWEISVRGIESTANSVFQDESVVRLVVKDDGGSAVFSKEKKEYDELVTRKSTITHKSGNRETVIGEVEISLSQTKYQSINRQLLAYSILIILLILASIVTVTGFLIRSTLRRPLEELKRIAGRYASGIYDTEGSSLPYREFLPFSAVLAHMADKINEQINVARNAEAKYREIFENATEGIFQSTFKGGFLIANPAMATILGYDSPDDLISSLTDLGSQLYVQSKDREKLFQSLETREGVSECEIRFYRKDRQEIWVLLRAHLVRDEKGSPLHVEGLLTDITDRKRSEEELKQAYRSLEQKVEERTSELKTAKEAAEAANHTKSLFLANMSHELRTPLNAILGYSHLLMHDSTVDPRQKEYLDIITRSGEHLLELINDVLELSKIEAGHLALEPAAFELPALLHDLHAMFRIKAENKGLSLHPPESAGLPCCLVADKKKLRQALINMMGNAIKFTESGSVTLRAAADRQSGAGIRLIVEVEDTGPGIAADELDKVFEVFEQAAAGRRSREGTGLGMAISRDYARMMGGDLTVSSHLGKGSVFRLEIPVEEGHATSTDGNVPVMRVAGLKAGQASPRVLVAEDGEENRLLMVRLLEKVGFEVRAALNGLEAADMFGVFRPDFIWMDIRMPVMDGIEATSRIRDAAGGRETVIVALSASGLEEERERIMACGFNGFVRKPFREREIFEVMATCLEIDYDYGGEPLEDSAGAESGSVDPTRLAALPDGLREKLHETLLTLDSARIMKLLETVTEYDPVLGGALQHLAGNYAFGRILEYLERASMSDPPADQE
jgi:PAS domain S-box-containing protein